MGRKEAWGECVDKQWGAKRGITTSRGSGGRKKPRAALAEVTNIEIKNGEADVTAPQLQREVQLHNTVV